MPTVRSQPSRPSGPRAGSGLAHTALLGCIWIAGFAGAAGASPPAGPPLPNYLGTLPQGTLTSAIPTLSDPTQSWELYLPQGFSPTRKWPVLILFDPRARGKVPAALFRDAADEFGWVLASSNNTMSDGPGEPNARAINAMIPDVMKR
ncbi:MAG: hypothetical protein ABIV06_07955, partial [Thermoanaerobaculia bacterium]